MDASGGSGAGKILFTFLMIGCCMAYWFYVSSDTLVNKVPDFSRSPILPVQCSIEADRASESRASAHVYLWAGNIAIDADILTPTRMRAHEIIKPSKDIYAWREGDSYGTYARDVDSVHILDSTRSGINHWLCMPWFFPNFSKFTVPTTITFL